MAVSRPGPKPISWEPNGNWDGVDGQWSSFSLRTGTPPQTSRVLPATAGIATWVIDPDGCPAGDQTPPDCPFTRGGLFRNNASRTWIYQGTQDLGIERNLGPKFDVAGYYGLDTVSLGGHNNTNSPSLDSQVVATVIPYIHFTGMFGLRDSPTNLSKTTSEADLSDSYPSYLTSLKTKNLIPSLSWAYTAGASYRNGTNGALASLTLGGYDAERFTPNNISFSLAPDIDRDLVVGLRSLTSTTRNGSSISFLESPILTFIDSTVPLMIFPQKAADLIAENLGLQYNPEARVYFVPEKVHARLSKLNPNITFTLGNSLDSGPTVDIVLPYSSFDLTALPPLALQPTRYFPLRVGNDSTYCLGRPFLQEAYLITNYEHQNFSVSQTRFDNLHSTKKDLVALPAAIEPPTPLGNPPIVPTAAPSPTAEPKKEGLSRQARVGVIAGTTGAVAISFIILGLLLWRWRKYKKAHPGKTFGKPQMVKTLQKQEMDGHGVSYKPKFAPVAYSVSHKDGRKGIVPAYADAELGAHGEILEMPGPDNPRFQELMARPEDAYAARGKGRKSKRSFAANVGNKYSSRQHKTQEDMVQPPVSKFCRVPMACLPSRGEGFTDLNRTLPPIPVWESPAITRLSSPLPNTRRVTRNPVQ